MTVSEWSAELALEMVKRGESLAAIANTFGVNRSTVYRRLQVNPRAAGRI
jgi:DNA-binding phage protein